MTEKITTDTLDIEAIEHLLTMYPQHLVECWALKYNIEYTFLD
jgi:hypothetical protein